MAQVNNKRAIVERLADTAVDEAAIRGKRVQTIDPILKTARKLYPFFTDRELQDVSSAALRSILTPPPVDPRQTTLAF